MEVGMVGLGWMGMNMAVRLLRGKHRVVAYNRSPEKVDEMVKKGARGAYTLEEVVKKLKQPRTLWLMLLAGKVTDNTIETLRTLLAKGDVIVDGGNSFFKDDLRREQFLRTPGLTIWTSA